MPQDLLRSLGFSEEAIAKVAKVYDEGITTKLERKDPKSPKNENLHLQDNP